MIHHYADLCSASDWSCCVGKLFQPIRSTTQISVVMRHQYGISALVSQVSFGRETSGSIAKCWLFSQAIKNFMILWQILPPVLCGMNRETIKKNWSIHNPYWDFKVNVRLFQGTVTHLQKYLLPVIKIRFNTIPVASIYWAGWLAPDFWQNFQLNSIEIMSGWALPNIAHADHIWFKRPNWWSSTTPSQMWNFFVLLIAHSTCMRKLAISWVFTSSSAGFWLELQW